MDSLFGITNPEFSSKVPLSGNKDIKLFSILKTDSSKVVDENGEPMEQYRGIVSSSPNMVSEGLTEILYM